MMPFRFTLIAASALALLPLTTVADAKNRIARNGAVVVINGDSMRVFQKPFFGTDDYYCAAGDVARGLLRARATDRIVVERVPAAGDYTFGFRVDRGAKPEPRPSGGIFPSKRKVGASRSVAASEHLCDNSPQFR
jgi:hypothetical protein